jgi:hypothetical protein
MESTTDIPAGRDVPQRKWQRIIIEYSARYIYLLSDNYSMLQRYRAVQTKFPALVEFTFNLYILILHLIVQKSDL